MRGKVVPLDAEQKDIEADDYIKPKEQILKKIDDDIADIAEYESYASFHGLFCRCCFFSNIFGVLMLMFGFGLTPLFQSVAPKGAEMFIVIGAGVCLFVPFMVWAGLKLCPMAKYARHREHLQKQKRKRQEVTDKRLRYLYNKEVEEEDEDAEVVITEADKAINQQIKFAQINAAFEAKNRAYLASLQS